MPSPPPPPPPPSCLSSLAVHLYPISSVLNCLHVRRIPNMPVYKFNFHCLCSSACLVWTRCVDRVARTAREIERRWLSSDGPCCVSKPFCSPSHLKPFGLN
ncbi:unnamed protein product [Musa acuminata var. zebrina]